MMNVNRNIEMKLSQKELETLIEKYFDCETSDEEERRLRSELADCRYESPLIDECLVAMGYFSVGKKVLSDRKRHSRVVVVRRAMSVAATVAVIFVSALFLRGSFEGVDNGYCYAYVNGEKISDNDKVLALMQSDLSNLNDVTGDDCNSMMEQLSAIRNVLDD